MFIELSIIWYRWRIRRRIRKHGWTATYVRMGDYGDLAYSTGFQDSIGFPEVIMFGFDMESANALIGEARLDLKGGKLVLFDKAPWAAIPGARPMVWRKVHPSQIRREHFNVAIYEGERRGRSRAEIEAYQLLISDENNCFPWEAGYDLDYRPRQPALYEPYVGPPDDD